MYIYLLLLTIIIIINGDEIEINTIEIPSAAINDNNYSNYCQYELMYCQNGGYFKYCEKRIHQHFFTYNSCVCPLGWKGVDCSIPDLQCHNTTYSNGTFLQFENFPIIPSLDSKQYQCFVNEQDADTFHFADSRIQDRKSVV